MTFMYTSLLIRARASVDISSIFADGLRRDETCVGISLLYLYSDDDPFPLYMCFILIDGPALKLELPCVPFQSPFVCHNSKRSFG